MRTFDRLSIKRDQSSNLSRTLRHRGRYQEGFPVLSHVFACIPSLSKKHSIQISLGRQKGRGRNYKQTTGPHTANGDSRQTGAEAVRCVYAEPKEPPERMENKQRRRRWRRTVFTGLAVTADSGGGWGNRTGYDLAHKTPSFHTDTV